MMRSKHVVATIRLIRKRTKSSIEFTEALQFDDPVDPEDPNDWDGDLGVAISKMWDGLDDWELAVMDARCVRL